MDEPNHWHKICNLLIHQLIIHSLGNNVFDFQTLYTIHLQLTKVDLLKLLSLSRLLCVLTGLTVKIIRLFIDFKTSVQLLTISLTDNVLFLNEEDDFLWQLATILLLLINS